MLGDIWSWFWNLVLICLTAFVFITALMAVISVIVDLFRDHTIKGWQKAIWFVFLVFVPFLSTLVYLIARGPGMAKRSQEQQKAAQNAADSYIREVAGNAPVDQIARAKALLEAGDITAEEYAALKKNALSSV
ncbi:SHOCT domain-containing protein [Microbacterium sp. NC79]|uniref:SHOCT domain-containing protein n=1 Tax=Microbacterium sp. NC79 TaxID=2851009 RepID=UPI001C2C68D2|nr:SHOCT domain-containing protein [Microbacterium sp. NC79]MBV0893947.1 SHOCT domain-containing protein [Microbacterium sp. NC79]